MYENIGLKHRNKKVQVASNESLWQVMNYINQVSDQLITLGTVFEKLTVAELLSKFHVWRKTLIHSRVPKSSHDIYKLVQNTKTIMILYFEFNVYIAEGCVYLTDSLRWSYNSVDIFLPLSLRFWTVSPWLSGR